MRTFSVVLIILSLGFVSVFAQGNIIQPKQQSVGVYQAIPRSVNDRPLFTLSLEDRPCVLEQNGEFYKIQNSNGQIGWVEKRLVVVLDKKLKYTFAEAEVLGYLENPTPVYIMDADDKNATTIGLDRSFKDALSENQDREVFERQQGKH